MAITRAAIELLFTLPGIPLIYDGEEVGASFQPYAQGPPIAWRDRYGLTPLYARMSRERRRVRALTAPGLQLLSTDRDEDVLAYLRPGCGAEAPALIALNFDRVPVRVRLALRIWRAADDGESLCPKQRSLCRRTAA